MAPPVAMEDMRNNQAGTGPRNAIAVKSVAAEYEIVRALGYRVESQALRMEGAKAYDVLTVRSRDRPDRELWFDISSFFGGMF